MKRAILKKYGGVENFMVEKIDLPKAKDGKIMIENHASSINPVDIEIRKGNLKLVTGFSFPKVIGEDFSGVVIADADGFKKGDEVFGMLSAMRGGAYSEIISTDLKHLAPKPAHLSLEEAAVLPLVGLTAYQALIVHGRIGKDDNVFINGCTGGVGSIGVQMAKAAGAVVTGACSAKNMSFARDLGADYVFDYKKLNKGSLKEQFDIVFDTSGKLGWPDFKLLLKKNGRGASTRPNLSLMANVPFHSRFKIIKVDVRHLKDLKDFIEKYRIKPHISKEWGIDAIAEAHRDFEENKHVGKMLIRMKS